MKYFYHFSLVLILAISIAGCTKFKGIHIAENYEENIPKTAEINVIPIRQYDNYSCATTSLAMVMSYYENTTYRKKDVWEASGSSIHDVSKKCGNDMFGLKRAAKIYGYTNYEFVTGMKLQELKYLISNDIPVIINIRNYFNPKYSHAVVASGYDEENVFITDPSGKKYKVDNQKFLLNWTAHLCTPRNERFRNSAFILYKDKN